MQNRRRKCHPIKVLLAFRCVLVTCTLFKHTINLLRLFAIIKGLIDIDDARIHWILGRNPLTNSHCSFLFCRSGSWIEFIILCSLENPKRHVNCTRTSRRASLLGTKFVVHNRMRLSSDVKARHCFFSPSKFFACSEFRRKNNSPDSTTISFNSLRMSPITGDLYFLPPKIVFARLYVSHNFSASSDGMITSTSLSVGEDIRDATCDVVLINNEVYAR